MSSAGSGNLASIKLSLLAVLIYFLVVQHKVVFGLVELLESRVGPVVFVWKIDDMKDKKQPHGLRWKLIFAHVGDSFDIQEPNKSYCMIKSASMSPPKKVGLMSEFKMCYLSLF